MVCLLLCAAERAEGGPWSNASMQIGIVGGVERVERLYETVAASRGHQLVFHDGHVRGSGIRKLEQIIDHCDVVVLVTDVNSHAAVQLTRRLMREKGRSPVLTRRFGISRLNQLLDHG